MCEFLDLVRLISDLKMSSSILTGEEPHRGGRGEDEGQVIRLPLQARQGLARWRSHGEAERLEDQGVRGDCLDGVHLFACLPSKSRRCARCLSSPTLFVSVGEV